MHRTLTRVTLLLGFTLLFASCAKDKSYEPGTTTNTGGNNNGSGNTGGSNNGGTNNGSGNNGGTNNGGTDNGGTTAASGLTYQLDGGTKQTACVTAGVQDLAGQKAYVFGGMSDDGNAVSISVFTKELTTTTYTQASAGTSVGVSNLNTNVAMGVVVGTNSNVSITFTEVTATEFTFTFTGKMIVTFGGSGTHTISGTVKGKFNDTVCAE